MSTGLTYPSRPITEPRPVTPGLNSSWIKVPTMDSEETTDREYVARIINHKAGIRNWAVLQAALNERFYIGDQWAVPYARAARDGNTYRFARDTRYPGYFRSTTNLIAGACDNHIARISLREFVPTTAPKRGTASVEAAARIAKSYLLHHLGQIAWEIDKREDAVAHQVIHSTVGLVSWREQRNLSEPAILSAAMQCPACKTIYGNTKKLPASLVPKFKTNLDALREERVGPDEETQVSFGLCVQCDSREPLQEYQPTKQDVMGEDPFGLPIGMFEPGTGMAQLEVIPIFRMFPENGGCGIQPHVMRVCAYEMPRSLNWIAEHHGRELDLDALVPEDPRKLFSSDPILGGEFQYYWSGVTEAGVFDNHAMVKTVVLQPQWGLEKGLVLRQINDQIIKEPLIQPYSAPGGRQGEIEVMKLAFARMKRVPGLFWGRTPINDGIGIQRRINRIDTMQIWLREHGQPQLYLPPTAQVTNVEEAEEGEAGLALRQFRVHHVPPGWNLEQALFPGQPMTGNVYEQERRVAENDFTRVCGPSTIERGMATPSDPKTTTGLALLRNEAAREREPSEAAFSHMCEIGWTHQLELTQAYHTEEDVYAIKTASGRRELREFNAAELMDHVDVTIETQTHNETVNELRDGTSMAIQAGLYDMADPDAREQALINLNLPRNVNEQRGIQMRNAEEAWSRFLHTWKIPEIDYSLHDPQLWFSILGRRWLDDEGRELREAAGWDAVIPKIAGWGENLALETERDRKQRDAYGMIPPERWPAQYQMLVAAYKQAEDQRRIAQEKAVGAGGAGDLPPIPEPPAPPGPQGFLPMALDQRIAYVLLKMLGIPPNLPEPGTIGLPREVQQQVMLRELTKMYSVILAFEQLRKARMAPAPGGIGEPSKMPQRPPEMAEA